MGRLKFNKKEPFTIIERKGKDGKVSFIRHTTNGFQTISVSGKVKIPNSLTDSSPLYFSIRSIGFDFLGLFPDFLVQQHSKAILTYTIPINPSPQRTLWYDFQYTIKGGSDIEAALTELLAKQHIIKERITACTKLDPEQSFDP